MAELKLDELNILSGDSENNELDGFDYEEFIEHYFDPMQLSKKQKEKRKELSKELLDIILYFLIWCEDYPDRVITEEIQEEFQNKYKDKVLDYAEPSTFFDTYIPLFIATLIDTTLSHKGETYFTSVERAAVVAVNESNHIFGNEDYENAKALGKQYKVWRTELDERVRPTHRLVEGKKVPIDEPFLVGQSLMMYPKDDSLGASADEIVNCRCVCSYS